MTEPLDNYIVQNWLREPDVLRRLREETAQMPNAGMQISPDQGQFMSLLVKLIGARRYLEIGVFTGYSSLAVALALPEDGQVVACDVSEEYTSMARRYWQEAGVAGKIDLRIAPASQTLKVLADEGTSFDFAFIDADKSGYRDYYERALTLLRPGGLIAIDNVLWAGRIVDMKKTDPDTLALRDLNAALTADERIDLALVPIGDGLTLARKK
jgi:caffeoyl-CoA O-methyltransferase